MAKSVNSALLILILLFSCFPVLAEDSCPGGVCRLTPSSSSKDLPPGNYQPCIDHKKKADSFGAKIENPCDPEVGKKDYPVTGSDGKQSGSVKGVFCGKDYCCNSDDGMDKCWNDKRCDQCKGKADAQTFGIPLHFASCTGMTGSTSCDGLKIDASSQQQADKDCAKACYEKWNDECTKKGNEANLTRMLRKEGTGCQYIAKEEIDSCREFGEYNDAERQLIDALNNMAYDDMVKSWNSRNLIPARAQATGPAAGGKQEKPSENPAKCLVDEVKKLTPDQIQKLRQIPGIEAVARDPSKVTELTPDQFKQLGAAVGKDILPLEFRAKLSPEQALAYYQGIRSTNPTAPIDLGGNSGYSDAALSAIRKSSETATPAARVDTSKANPAAAGGGLGDMAKNVAAAGGAAGALQQIMGLAEKLMGNKGGNSAASTAPGTVTTPAAPQGPATSAGNTGVVITEAAGCGDYCVNKSIIAGGVECIQASGATTTVTAAGTPGCTQDDVIVANPAANLTNDATNMRNVVAPIVAKTDASVTPTMRTDITLPAGSSALVDGSSTVASSAALAAATYAPRRLTIDMSDEVTVFDHESLTNIRVPYDTTANEKPLYHFVTGMFLIDAGELYPRYLSRPAKENRGISSRVSYYRRVNPDAGRDEVSLGWVDDGVARVTSNKDSRIDLWASTSFISTVSEGGFFRGLSTLVDGHNLDAKSIYSYILDARPEYSYVVDDGIVMVQSNGRIIESTAGLPLSTVLPTHLRVLGKSSEL